MTDFHEQAVALAITLPLTMQDIVLWCTELGEKAKISKTDALSLLEGLKGDPESMELIMEAARSGAKWDDIKMLSDLLAGRLVEPSHRKFSGSGHRRRK